MIWIWTVVHVRGRFKELKIEYLNGVTHLLPVNMLIPMYVKSCDVHELDLDLTHDKDWRFQIQQAKSRGQDLDLDLANDKDRPQDV